MFREETEGAILQRERSSPNVVAFRWWLQEDKAATQKEVELQMEMAKWAAFGEE